MPGPEEFNILPIEPDAETKEEDITRKRKIEQVGLIAAHKENSPELKDMLVKWMEETSIPQDSEQKFEGWEYADVAIMHAVMQYRLGFSDKNQVLDDLELVGMGLENDQDEQSQRVYQKLRKVMASIEFDTFTFDIDPDVEAE